MFVHRRGLDPAPITSLRMRLSTHPIRSWASAILPGDDVISALPPKSRLYSVVMRDRTTTSPALQRFGGADASLVPLRFEAPRSELPV